MRKRTAAPVLVVALALPLLPLTRAGADGAPGSGFGSVTLHAVAHGEEFLFSSTTQIPAQMSVPYAASSYQLGEGVGLATIAWPGDTAASLGTTLQVGFGAPPQASVLNDPAIAVARSGAGPADVSNTTVPGSTMHATATKLKATARAAADGTSALSTTAGSTTSSSSVELTGASSAAGAASSSVRDVTFAGLVHVGSVSSSANGTTDGTRANAQGATTVTGVTVAGVPVTVDEHGVSVAGNALLPPGATDAVTSALKQAQVTLMLTRPVKTVTGGRVDYSTGALVATTPFGTLTLGGAELVLGATPGDAASVPASSGLPATAPGGSSSVAPVTQPVTAVPGAGSAPPPVVTGSRPQGTTSPVLAAVPVSVRTGYGWAWLASGVLLAFLAGSGLLALSRRWLAPDLSGCPLERRPR